MKQNKLDLAFLALTLDVEVVACVEKADQKGEKYQAVTVKAKGPSPIDFAFVDSFCEIKSDKQIQIGKRKLRIRVVPYIQGNSAKFSLRILADVTP